MGYVVHRELLDGGYVYVAVHFFFFSSRRRHTRFDCDWSSDVCSSDLAALYQFLEYLGISFSERLHGAIHELNPQLSDAPGFIQDSAPELVVEIVNFPGQDRKSTRLNSSHSQISYAVFCLKTKKTGLGL